MENINPHATSKRSFAKIDDCELALATPLPPGQPTRSTVFLIDCINSALPAGVVFELQYAVEWTHEETMEKFCTTHGLDRNDPWVVFTRKKLEGQLWPQIDQFVSSAIEQRTNDACTRSFKSPRVTLSAVQPVNRPVQVSPNSTKSLPSAPMPTSAWNMDTEDYDMQPQFGDELGEETEDAMELDGN